MGFQSVFKRYEFKYLLTKKQQSDLIELMKSHMKPDRYPHSTIRNIYFDTESFRLIRRSIEKPVYKEKLRLRSYQRVERDKAVFLEIKKKYNHIVYKRRLSISEKTAIECITQNIPLPQKSQIADEINYFCSYYKNLRPVVFLSYERDAYFSPERQDFRVTFDKNVLFRCEDITFDSQIYGTPLLPEGKVLMEIKTVGGIPLWMTAFLTENKIFRTSFSKYGTAYQKYIFSQEITDDRLNFSRNI